GFESLPEAASRACEKPAADCSGRVKVLPQIAGALATEGVCNLDLKACLRLHHARVKKLPRISPGGLRMTSMPPERD
ncbi:hypothetical protein, partial [Methylobacterium goesingense]|uniref:hypothetical protein n=1 Tax=Methylobacterium goesingense TaxID=243690 RepID=UPI001EE37B47